MLCMKIYYMVQKKMLIAIALHDQEQMSTLQYTDLKGKTRRFRKDEEKK